MTWIETTPPDKAEGPLKDVYAAVRGMYPPEYGIPGTASAGGGDSIIPSHSLIPEALYHSFAAFATMMKPELPLERRHHEMIATVVSVTNRCRY